MQLCTADPLCVRHVTYTMRTLQYKRLLSHRVHLHRCLHHHQTGLTCQVAKIYAQSGLLSLRLCEDICMPHVSEYPQCHAWHIDHLLLRMHGLSTNMSTDTLQGVSTDPEKLGPKAAVVNGKNVLQLLNHCNGSFRPGILTALVGSSGAGKTTLMDVLAGRKTSKPTCAFRYLKLCLSCIRLCLSCIRLCLSCIRLCLSCITMCLSCPTSHCVFPASDCAFPYIKLCLACIRLCLQPLVARYNLCLSYWKSLHYNRTELG